MIFGIDQNCHPLWDPAPKLAALAAGGATLRQYIEDVDAAFSTPGAEVGDDTLQLARERYHRGGGADWGAALFYTGFLGRVPIDVRAFEGPTGMKLAALARNLPAREGDGIGRSVDDLYDEFSPGDNWQLIGSSYAGDRDHHRTLADLSVREVEPMLRELLDKAEADMRRRFPAQTSQRRLNVWFGEQRQRVDGLLRRHAAGRLTDLYADWLAAAVPDGVEIAIASDLFACGADAGQRELLNVFVRDYDQAAGLYNEALAESDVALRPLDTERGELPMFATFDRDGRNVRAAMSAKAGEVKIAERTFALTADGALPFKQMAEAGVAAVTGKAVLLVIQARVGRAGAPLALPYRGSVYVPASHVLTDKLAGAGLLPDKPHPILRVRFHLLERLAKVDVPIHLPEHVAAAAGEPELPARRLAEAWAALREEARVRLRMFADDEARSRWQRERFADIFEELEPLNSRRREMARRDPKSPEIRRASKRARRLEANLLNATVRQIDRDMQMAEMDFYDSRGALRPWCIALGGHDFYDEVLRRCEFHVEDPSGRCLPCDVPRTQ